MVHNFRKTTEESIYERGGFKKILCAIRLIINRAFKGYDEVALILDEWWHKYIYKIISGLDIINVHDEIYNY